MSELTDAIESLYGVWVKVTYEHRTRGQQTEEGLSLKPTDGEPFMDLLRLDGTGWSNYLSLIRSANPSPMPEPPEGTILEWTENWEHNGFPVQIVAHRDGLAPWGDPRAGAWQVAGREQCTDWEDLGATLATEAKPLTIVRWGK